MTIFKTIICAFFTMIFFTARSQGFASIDARARSISSPKGQNIRTLAADLSEGCTTEKEKVRAFFVWICENIKYDIKTFENKKDIEVEKRKALNEPENVLKNHKAVCEGYSNLFIALCNEANIKALKVAGLSKNQAGRVSRGGHAWCIVRTEGQWSLVDPTWGAGDIDLDEGKYTKRFKEKYFFTAPETMILDHYPMDPLFQMLQNPWTLEEFKRTDAKAVLTQKLAAKPLTGFEHIPDSLNVFIGLDSTKMLHSAGTRMLAIEPNSNAALFNLGLYHFQSANQGIQAYQQERNEMMNTRKMPPAAWYDQQIALVNSLKSKLEKSIGFSSRSVINDNYSNGLRTLRRNAENTLGFLDKDLENLKKNKSRSN